MASSSTLQRDVDAEILVAAPPGVITDAGTPDLHPERADTDQESVDLPDICNIDWQTQGMPDTEFNRKYPPDPWGEEAEPNARVWKIYSDQQDASHKGMLHNWNKTLDVLLIFAGLFSAVLTAFLIESYKVLQPDYTQYVAAFLYAAAVAHNRTGGVFPTLDAVVAPDRFVQTSAVQRWTNGLWFASLVISLAVALLCILIKQWLDAYDANVSVPASTPLHWARRHALYHRGLRKWDVPMLISFLPLLLHLSLFLFFVGLVLFLHPLDGAISYSLLVMVSFIAAFYIMSVILPAWCVECPSYAPLLPQTLLVVSRMTSVLAHLLKSLSMALHRREVTRAVSELTWRGGQWLTSIQLYTAGHLMRENRTISRCDRELDGYVLSTLIHLPIETNPDVVNAACATIGAVTSTSTMEVLSRKLTFHAFTTTIEECENRIPGTDTGFAITSQAKLHRARQAMRAHSDSHWQRAGVMRLNWEHSISLGIDGSLLNVISGQATREWPFEARHLISQLQSITRARGISRRSPLRSTCLTFLKAYSRFPHPDWHPRALAIFLLVFCAGRFRRADMHEFVYALQIVETVLKRTCSITLPVHNGGERGYIYAVVNGLWMVLADYRRYHIDTLTAHRVAAQALTCLEIVHRPLSPCSWVHFSGLSSFTRSPTFLKCVGSGSTLIRYIWLFDRFTIVDRARAELDDHWICITALLKMTWDCARRPSQAGFLANLFSFGHFSINQMRLFNPGTRFATQCEWEESALSALLDGPYAIASWTGANSPDRAHWCIIELANLARRISIVLCHRQRLGRANASFVRGFFAGAFLLTRFRDLLSREDVPSEEANISLEELVFDLAKHCLKLSPESFMAITVQLEETGDAGSELRARAAAFAQRLRDGSAPGGELSGECSADCPCVIKGPRADAERGWREVWKALATRVRRARTEPATAEHV